MKVAMCIPVRVHTDRRLRKTTHTEMPESTRTVVGGVEMRPRHRVCDVQQNVAVVADELLGD